MRSHGTRFELVPMRPHDHIGWVYSGLDEFAILATSFLRDGASKGERLMLVVEDPEVDALAAVAEGFGPAAIELATIAEVYGSSGVVDPRRSYATLAGRTELALTAGFTGLRVVADNTSLVLSDDALEAWIGWELMADRFMVEGKLTALCAFDRTRVCVDTLRHLATLHPLSSATEPTPQFMMFADDGSVCIEGEVDSVAVSYLRRALEVLPPATSVVVDLSRAHVRGNTARASLFSLAEGGIEVTLVGMTRHRVAPDHDGVPAQA
jgi:MEDS: MEthanogen/methylotroph, DcmR Sensory domain